MWPRSQITTQKFKKPIQPIQQIQKKTISPKIINLSQCKLAKPELSLLRTAPIAPTSKGNSLILKSDIFYFNRLIEIQEIFYGQDFQDVLFVSKTSEKQEEQDEQEALQKLITNKVLMDKTYYRDHLVNKEYFHSNVYKKVSLDSHKKVYKQLILLVEIIYVKFDIKIY